MPIYQLGIVLVEYQGTEFSADVSICGSFWHCLTPFLFMFNKKYAIIKEEQMLMSTYHKNKQYEKFKRKK